MSYFFIQTPEASMTFIGIAKPTTDGWVWLCTPGGKPVIKVPKHCVHLSSPKEMADRLKRDLEASRTEGN